MSAPSENVIDVKEEKVEMDESHSTTAEDPCPVCLSNRVDESGIDGCTHTFCYSCISEWLKVSESCPLCKAPVTEVKTTANGKSLIKKLSELKAEAEAARIMAQANEVPMTSEREAVTQLIHQHRASVQKIIADKSRHKKNKFVKEQYKMETSRLTQLTALRDEMDRLPRRDVMGDTRFRQVVYMQQLVWKSISRPSTAIRFNCAFACADPDKLRQRLKPFLMRELKIIMDPKKQPNDRVLELIFNAVQNHEINNPNFELVLMNSRLFIPSFIGTFAHLLYEFCASGLELDAFDANSTYSVDPSRGPLGRLIPNLLPSSSRTNEPAIFIEDNEGEDDDDSVIIDRALRSDSSSSDGVTGLYNHRACRLPPSQIRNSLFPLSSSRQSALRDMQERWNNLPPPSFSVPNFGNVPPFGRVQSLFPSQSISRRIADPEVIALEDEAVTGDEARINSIPTGDIDSSVPSWLRNVSGEGGGGGPSTSTSFGSRLNPLSVNKVDRSDREGEISRRRENGKDEKMIETSWRMEKERKEQSRREKRRHEERKEEYIDGVRVGSRKNTAQYYYTKIMKGDLSIDELQRLDGELTTFTNRIKYLKEECNNKLAEKRRTNGRSDIERRVFDVEEDVIDVEEEQPGPSNAQDDSVILCDS